MQKKLIAVLIGFCLACGCSSTRASVSKTEEKTEAEVICEQLIDTLAMSNMSRVKDRVILGMIFGGDQSVINDACMYRSDEDGNYDMVGVFYSDNMDECKNYVDEYLLTIKDESNIYYPQEVFKISNSIEKHDDEKLILIICDDIESAREHVVDLVGE